MSNLDRRHFLSLCAVTAVPPLGRSSADGRSLQPPSAASFPALRQQIGGRPLTYLDSAATTLRPQAVIDALADFYATDNANPAPVHTLARRAASRLAAARQTVARFINAPSPNEVVFTRGTTEGINLTLDHRRRRIACRCLRLRLRESLRWPLLMPWIREALRFARATWPPCRY